MSRFVLGFALSLLVAVGLPANAAASDEAGTLSITLENDVFAGTDRHYTSGVRVGYVTGPQKPKGLERLIAGERAETGTFRRSFAVAQAIYTPSRYQMETPYDWEHPYAGNLFGEYAFVTEKDRRWDLFTLELGVVGPWAQAEEVQNGVHDAFGFVEAEGWDNQLGNEITANVAYDWKGKAWAQGSFGQSGLAWEMTPVLGASFGTVAVNVRGGGMVRFGTDLSSHFGPARIRPSLTSTAHFDRQRAFTWYAFAGAQGRVVAHDIFLDGSLLRDNSPSVEKNTVVTDMQAGIALNLGPAQLSFTYLRRSERFETQEGADGFGGLTLSFKR